MTTARALANVGEVIDWTPEMLTIPNEWDFINNLGIFEEEGIDQHSVVFEEIIKNGTVLVDRIRGDRHNMGKDYSRKLHTFAVPHFPEDDYISPQDIQGKRAYGKPDQVDNLAEVRARKFERIARAHSWTLKVARAQALTAGTVYAPNGTVSQNWFTEFGKTQTSVNIQFSVDTTDVQGGIETALAAIQDNSGSSVTMTGVVCLCSPGWFSALTKHPKVASAFQYYTSSQEPLRNRLAPGGSPVALHREFYWQGVRFVEMRDAFNGVPLIPANTAVMIPTGTDAFKTYFSPANKFGHVNTIGERMYVFEYNDGRDEKIELQSESNFVNALLRPELVIALTKS